MAESSFPFAVDTAGDRTVSAAMHAAAYAALLDLLGTRGIAQGLLNDLAVTESSPQAATVDVDTGMAFVGLLDESRFYINDGSKTMTVTSNSSGNDRIDTLVLEMDTDTSVRKIQLVVVAGTPDASPVAPTLTQTEAKYQFPLYDIAADDGFTVIANADLTDRRTYLASGGGTTLLDKTSDETVNNSTTLQNDDDITFAIDANKNYAVWGHFLVEGNGSADIKINWSLPGTSTLDTFINYLYSTGAHVGTSLEEGAAVPISTDAVATPASNASFQGVIKADGTGGTVTLQWAQNSAHASDTKMLAGTWLAYQLLN